MKKLISPLILIFLLTVCALTLASCSTEQLKAPSGFILDGETITLKWNAVKGAKSVGFPVYAVLDEVVREDDIDKIIAAIDSFVVPQQN